MKRKGRGWGGGGGTKANINIGYLLCSNLAVSCMSVVVEILQKVLDLHSSTAFPCNELIAMVIYQSLYTMKDNKWKLITKAGYVCLNNLLQISNSMCLCNLHV